jgi:hypothetical protein
MGEHLFEALGLTPAKDKEKVTFKFDNTCKVPLLKALSNSPACPFTLLTVYSACIIHLKLQE